MFVLACLYVSRHGTSTWRGNEAALLVWFGRSLIDFVLSSRRTCSEGVGGGRVVNVLIGSNLLICIKITFFKPPTAPDAVEQTPRDHWLNMQDARRRSGEHAHGEFQRVARPLRSEPLAPWAHACQAAAAKGFAFVKVWSILMSIHIHHKPYTVPSRTDHTYSVRKHVLVFLCTVHTFCPT